MRCSPPVRMNRSGSGASPSASAGRERLLVDARRVRARPRRASSATAGARPARCPSARRRRRRRTGRAAGWPRCVPRRGACPRIERGASAERSPMKRRRTPLLGAARSTSRSSDFDEQLHQHADLVGRPLPVLAGEREQRQRLDAAARAVLDDGAHRLDAGAMPAVARQCRRSAQRPLPSMMTATWRGTGRWLARGLAGCIGGRRDSRAAQAARPASAPFPSRPGPRRPRRRTCR